MVKNPPSSAGDAGSNTSRGTKIPHAVGQILPCATTRKSTQPKKKKSYWYSVNKKVVSHHILFWGSGLNWISFVPYFKKMDFAFVVIGYCCVLSERVILMRKPFGR